MLTKFRLKNFRSFADTGEIEVKPINFLVGANSSGKSSILKFFPLLKQSVGGRPFNGVFRWLSDDVDFRDFNNTIRYSESVMNIELVFDKKNNITFDVIQYNEFFDKFKSISLYDGKRHCYIEEWYLLQKNNKESAFFPTLLNANDNQSYQMFISANFLMLDYAQSVKYIKPIRANIERYYRLRNDSIEEIASDGSNLPMFLFCLTPKLFKQFNDFLNENFSFGVDIKKSEGNIEIHILEKDSISRNAVDMGYGYTEMLPILATIWNSISKNKDSFIVIEQPEVHLHPKFQAKFAKMLLKVIAKYKNVRFFIETHSETILNTLGREVGYERANPDAINILRIEKQNGISTVKSTGYDNEGYLKDWPINFLDEDAD